MANGEDDIVQRIVLDGDKAAIGQFAAVGKAGSAAFDRINAAGARTTQTLGSIGSTVAGVRSALGQTGEASTAAAEGLDHANKKALTLSATLRLLSRATGVRELGRLGRSLNVLGRAFSVAAPSILAIGLAKVAQVGTAAADKFADLAGSLKITTTELGKAENVGTATGVTFDEMSKSLKAVDDMTKQSAENTDKNADTFRHLRDAMIDTKNAGVELLEGYRRIGTEGRNAFREFSKTVRNLGEDAITSGKDFATSLRNIQEQRDALEGRGPNASEQKRRALRDLDEQEAKLKEQFARAELDRTEQLIKAQEDYVEGVRKRQLELVKLDQEVAKNVRQEKEHEIALVRAKREAEENATALDKLGVSTFDSQGKLKKSTQVMLDIADAMQRVTDPTVLAKIELDLVAAGIERNLLPALRRGRKGYEEFAAAGKNINPQFTTEQIKIADAFNIALSQAGEAARALGQQLGIAIAPLFQGFLERLRDILVEIRPGIIEFGVALSKVLGPFLEALAILIQRVIIPAIEGLASAFTVIAGLLNDIFGTKITGAEVFVALIAGLIVVFGGWTAAIVAATIALAPLLDKIKENKLVLALIAVAVAAVAVAFASIPVAIALVLVAFGLIANWLKSLDWKTFVSRTSAAWGQVAQFIASTWEAIKQGATDAWQWAVDKAQGAATLIITLWTNFITGLQFIWDSIVAGATTAWTWVSDQATIAADYISGIFATVRDKIIGYWTSIRDFITGVWTAVRDKVADLVPSSGTAPAGFAGGGAIRGAGTATSDSIPIFASNGEFMHRAAAVRKYGLNFMHAVNSLRFDPAGFNVGGLVSFNAPQPRTRFADGGLVQGNGGTLNLSIDGQEFSGLRAPANTMKDLTRYANERIIRSAGRKPGWSK